jgi:hypothetical protein
MWVAYLVPREDHHLIVQDGLGYIEVAPTEYEAMAKVRAIFEGERNKAIEDSISMGWPADEPTLEECYAIHTNEV